MGEIIGGIAAIVLVVGIYIYYGRKVLNFIRGVKSNKHFKESVELQRLQDITDSMTEEDWKNYGAWMKRKIEEEDVGKGKKRFTYWSWWVPFKGLNSAELDKV